MEPKRPNASRSNPEPGVRDGHGPVDARESGKRRRRPGALPPDDIHVAAHRDPAYPRLGLIFRLNAVQTLPRPVEEVFPFFANAHHLESITPEFLRFRVLTPAPIDMRAGTEIRYKLKVRGFPISWRATILDWDPPHRFIDNQDAGPYALWRHTHSFTPAAGGRATICKDEVLYKPKGWLLAPLINRLVVQRDIITIFRHRFKKLEERFPPRA